MLHKDIYATQPKGSRSMAACRRPYASRRPEAKCQRLHLFFFANYWQGYAVSCSTSPTAALCESHMLKRNLVGT
jgi:hypothetical protein